MKDTSITELQTEGYEGSDLSLDIALFDYGLAWKDEGENYSFIYGVGISDNNDWNRFAKTEVSKTEDVYEAYDWADFKGLHSSYSVTKEEWDKQDLVYKISDLLNYYGYENVFGSTYHVGAEIKEE